MLLPGLRVTSLLENLPYWETLKMDNSVVWVHCNLFVVVIQSDSLENGSGNKVRIA